MEDGPPGFRQGYTCPVVLGYRSRKVNRFDLRDCYPLWSAFPVPFNDPSTFHFRRSIQTADVLPHNPGQTTPVCLAFDRFGLFPVRSPLLRESHMVSFPAGTEMFQFSAFAPYGYELTVRRPTLKVGQVSLFGYLRLKACLAAPRSFSQPSTSFVASRCQGIHRTPVFAYIIRTYHRIRTSRPRRPQGNSRVLV